MENFEIYINEMRQMQKRASAEKPKTEKTEETDSFGKLEIIVTAVNGLYPIKSAKVDVFSGTGESAKPVTTVYTDTSGKTPPIILPTPKKSVSQKPDTQAVPYALYNVHVTADGFVGQTLLDLSVFSGVTSLQKVNLTLLSASGVNREEVRDEMPHYDL